MAIGAASSTPKEHLLLSHVDYRRYPGCTAMLLTPEVAQTWLDSAGRRPTPSDKSKIAAYAQVMLDGEWQPAPCSPSTPTADWTESQTVGSCPLRCLDSGCRVHRMYTLKPLTLNPDLYGIPSVETDPSRGAVCACAPASFPGRIQPAMLGHIVADLRLERDSAGRQSMCYGWC
jgi:hypothetical protein